MSEVTVQPATREVPQGPAGSALSVRDVSFAYVSNGRSTPVLDRLSFEIAQGSFVSVVGPSGAGKTTLFNVLAGLARPDSGSVLVDGVPSELHPDAAPIGYMLQKDLLLPWRTVLGNAMLAAEIRHRAQGSTKQRARDLLDRYGLAGFENSYPSELSGGMRQRVALVRTLLVDPKVILLDEPFSALDYQTRLYLEEELVGLCRQEGRTMMMVTHDVAEAVAMSDEVLVLSRRPATVNSRYRIERTVSGAGGPIAAREDPGFPIYCKNIWADLEQPIANRTKDA